MLLDIFENMIRDKNARGLLFLFFLLFLSACSPLHKNDVDRLNERSYAFHYKNLDSTLHYAKEALRLSADYDDGKAEAYNHLAFVSIAQMDYQKASVLLDSVCLVTDNQVEILVSDVQQMRLCQRESRNKNFYEYQERAKRTLRRIKEDRTHLSEHLIRRLIYAESEYAIVTSTYYYYIGQPQPSADALSLIDVNGDIQKDTAQYLNYMYQSGAGGILQQGNKDENIQKEWEYLLKCYMLAEKSGDVYWEANALQGMSEHMFEKPVRKKLMANNLPSIRFLNIDNVPDSLFAGYLAEKSLYLFQEYGDVYQVAGSYRTLASCYWAIGDYNAAGYYLNQALNPDTVISQAPDLVASIHERLSLTYSALNNIPLSNAHRNKYLDMQDSTRQDRQLEARAEQLDRSSAQLNVMIAAVIVMIVVVVVSMFLFDYLRKKKDKKDSLSSLLVPLEEWKSSNERYVNSLNEKHDEINEALTLQRMRISNNKKYNVESRAKMFLVNSVTPFIDRIIHEVNRLKKSEESDAVRQERYAYVAELSEKINDYNNVLTQWIQLQRGQLSFRIESFRVQDLLDIVSKSRMAFLLKGIDFKVEPTEDVVKADRILTLFMINTIADNARKFTPKGGKVTISSHRTDSYVEISVSDTGQGLSEEQLGNIFNHKISGGHGFGLMNCKGIVEKYRKMSQIFNVCCINAESEKGKGSRFFFRLPVGTLRLLMILFHFLWLGSGAVYADHYLDKAAKYTNMVYKLNVERHYKSSILYADSALTYLNMHYLSIQPYGRFRLVLDGGHSELPAELAWYRDGLETDYELLIFLRNEIAVAALALHDWSLYQYNNKVYMQLYKEKSADSRLGEYVRIMQRSEVNKTIAVVLLILLLGVILIAYYMLYYRHRIFFRFYVDKLEQINEMLLSDVANEEKLAALNSLEGLSNRQWPPALLSIIGQIKQTMLRSIEANVNRQLDIEMAEDELHRSELENQKLYVSNNVLDNCLSTLKHETMYYPSRIRQLVDGSDNNIEAISELVSYYKDLHMLLSTQAMRQIESVKQECRRIEIFGTCVLGDEVMMQYLFDILQRQSRGKTLDMEITEKENKYVVFHITMKKLPYRKLFTPSMQNIPFMICRQIVRENSEITNLRGCGIVADALPEGGTLIQVTLAKAR